MFWHLRELPQILLRFIRHPVQAMRMPVSLTWPAIIFLQVTSAMVSGILLGAFNRSWWDLATGVILLPLTTALINAVFSIFLYYFFSLFHATFLDIRKLASMVALALLPYFALHILSGWLAPIDLIGFCFTALLLIVGLIEQFGLEKNAVLRLIGGISFVFFVIWSIVQYRSTSTPADQNSHVESLDQLEHDVHK